MTYFRGLIEDILSELLEHHTEGVDIEEIVLGMISFNSFWTEEQRKKLTEKLQLHTVYEIWYKEKVILGGEDKDLLKSFIKFFESLQVRSLSEAIYETVGFIMTMKVGRGRVLTPRNFSIECYLEMNLGPIHLLDDLVSEVYIRWNKSFQFKRNIHGGLITRYLKDD